MLNAVSSYYHPTSIGPYSEKLTEFLNKLIHAFMSRLNLERYENPHPISWFPPHRDKITDQQIVEFCSMVLPCSLNLASSRKYVDAERTNLSILASIRPDIVIPPLIKKLDDSLETLTEPFKFTAAVKCIVSGARGWLFWRRSRFVQKAILNSPNTLLCTYHC